MASSTAGHVKIISGALDDSPSRGGTIVLRGVVDYESLQNLKVDDYQREQAPATPKSSIWQALASNEVLPDIELAIRSENFSSNGNIFTLKDDVYIVDGLQRVSTALQFLTRNAGMTVRLGCLVHFSTTREWERERFKKLNSTRSKLSPNVLLRNEREESSAVDLVYNLCLNDTGFVLKDRVCWQQKMARQEIMTALNMVKVITALHNHHQAAFHTSLYKVIPTLNKQVETVGTQFFRNNVKTFFDVVDKAWGIRMAQYQGAIHMRYTFLKTLARVLSDHYDFWGDPHEKKLIVSADVVRKLKSFHPNDPAVAALAGGSGKAHYVLYTMMRDHIDSGKRTKRLRSRMPGGSIDLETEETATEE